METDERREKLLRLLCRRRHETIKNLASEFGVSERTIRRDVEVLSLTKPLDTQAGRYGGGVYIMDGYSMDRMYMKAEELAVLQKLSRIVKEKDSLLTEEEKRILDSIILDYSEQNLSKKNKNFF